MPPGPPPPPPLAQTPGEMLRRLIPSNVSVAEAARRLGVSRQTLFAIIDGRSKITPGTALRLEAALPVPAETWLAVQAQQDLAQARKKPPRGVKRIA